jgi:hypothetical protein
MIRVADYWKVDSQEDTWCQWHMDWEGLNLEPNENLSPLQEELEKRRIPIIVGEDVLRWEHKPKGTFGTREAYQLKAPSDPLSNTQLWSKLWNLKHWPKITLFLWLVAHSSILTWDNLSKRGFVGPSMCLLCGEVEETMEHLLSSCHYTAQIWDQVALVMQLLPLLCYNNILESLPPQLRAKDYLNMYPDELTILRFWSPPSSSQILSPPAPGLPQSSPTSWLAPPKDFIKLNFDGASKGNLRPAGYGIVFRNHNGHILLISVGYIGHSTNNVAELWGLTKGLQIAIKNNFSQLVVEGDSQILINLLRKILNGASPDKISPSWRLLHGLQSITDSL